MLEVTRMGRLLFGLRVAPLRLGEVVSLAEDAVRTRSRLLVGVVNAAKIVKLRHDAFLRDSLLECDLLLADGQSVVWASSILGQPLPERVAGIEVFEELLALADRQHLRVYLLGATPEVLDLLLVEIARRWPGVVLAGARDGYFAVEDSAEVAGSIRAARADMLFLGMTTPKKEIFLGTYADRLGVPVLHGVGGSFDVVAGITRRAPRLWQRLGMEWAYRVLQEPRRLWKRYLVTNVGFAAVLVRERLRPTPAYAAPAQPSVPVPVRMPVHVPAQRGRASQVVVPHQRRDPAAGYPAHQESVSVERGSA